MEKRVNLYYPKQETYFICWDNERQNIMAYDSVTPKQCLSTKWTEIDYYINKDLWLKVLSDYNIHTEYL